jgi:hypothetical protein
MRGDDSGATVYPHIADVIHAAAVKELEDLEE